MVAGRPVAVVLLLAVALPQGTGAMVLMNTLGPGPATAPGPIVEMRGPNWVNADYNVTNGTVRLVWQAVPDLSTGYLYEVVQDGVAIWNGTANELEVAVGWAVATVFQVVATMGDGTAGPRYQWVVWAQGGEGSPLDPNCPWFVLAIYSDLPLVGLVVREECVIPVL